MPATIDELATSASATAEYLRTLEKLAVVVNGKVVGDWPRTDLSLAPHSATFLTRISSGTTAFRRCSI